MNRALPLLLGLPLALGLLATSGRAEDPADAAKVDPHASADRCASCHQEAAEGATPADITWVGGHPDKACYQCHERDPHEVGLAAERTVIPDHMLLYDDVLACFTCHDEPACDAEPRDASGSYHLRGGPYSSDGAFCAACHQVESTERYNPHAAMTSGDPNDEVCVHCHIEPPVRESNRKTELKVATENICLGCHPEMPHAGAHEHLGPIPVYMQARVQASTLPLSSHGNIVCRTCHDPHPAAVRGLSPKEMPPLGEPVMPEGWMEQVLGPVYAARGATLGTPLDPTLVEPDHLRRPLTDGQLCKSCHDVDLIETRRGKRR